MAQPDPKAAQSLFTSTRPSPNRPNQPMEDRWSFTNLFYLGDYGGKLIGVYDGHGGPETSTFLSEAIPQPFQKHRINWSPSTIVSDLDIVFRKTDDEITRSVRRHFGNCLWSYLPDAAKRSFVNAKFEKDPALEDVVRRARSGSTALVAYIDQRRIITANVGDCRAVLARLSSQINQIEAVPLTEDQDCHNPEEVTRLRAEHPEKEWETLVVGGRLFGQMPLTRSFGDTFYKCWNADVAKYVFGSPLVTEPKKMPYEEAMGQYSGLIKSPPYLTAAPVVKTFKRSSDDRFLVIASDGLWSVKGVTNEWVVDIVHRALVEKHPDPSAYLMKELEKLHPGDDVTIHVYLLTHDTP